MPNNRTSYLINFEKFFLPPCLFINTNEKQSPKSTFFFHIHTWTNVPIPRLFVLQDYLGTSGLIRGLIKIGYTYCKICAAFILSKRIGWLKYFFILSVMFNLELFSVTSLRIMINHYDTCYLTKHCSTSWNLDSVFFGVFLVIMFHNFCCIRTFK